MYRDILLFVQYGIVLLKGRFFILNNGSKKTHHRFDAPKSELNCSIFSRQYWREARNEFSNPKTLVFAALIIALRVIVKMAKIPLVAGLSLTFDCYINALGSIVYGPIVAICVGAISDTLGCMLFQAVRISSRLYLLKYQARLFLLSSFGEEK